jgi:hypothetical protein
MTQIILLGEWQQYSGLPPVFGIPGDLKIIDIGGCLPQDNIVILSFIILKGTY